MQYSIKKAFQKALGDSDYDNQKQFCEGAGSSSSLISLLKKNSPETQIGSIAAVARGFDMTVSEFIALGE